MKKITHLFYFLLFVLVSDKYFAAAPTIQASNLNIIGRSANYLTVSWTRGNGTGLILTCKPSGNSTSYPVGGCANYYSASYNYGAGSNLGNSNYVVYDGTGTSLTIFGLNPNTSYTIYAFEYNDPFVGGTCNDNYLYYKTTVSSNTDNAYTLCTEPTTGPSSLSVTNITYTSARINWTAGNGSYDLVTVDQSPFATYYPTDGTTYTANMTVGMGSTTGSDNYVVFNGSGSYTHGHGLNSATTYRARIFDFNCTGGQQNYYTAGYNYVDFTTANYPPTINAIASQTVCESNGLQVAYINGISSGSTTESQTITISAVSNNQTLIPNANITPSYSSPNSFGYIYYTPAAGQSGTAVITVTVNDNFSSTNITQETFTVNVVPYPSAATAFSGNTTVCAGGGNQVYIEPAIANASSYNWTVPPGWAVVSGQGTQTLTVNPGSSASNGTISVYGINLNGCGSGNSYTTNVTVNAQPTTPNAGPDQSPLCTSTAFLLGNSLSGSNTGVWSVLLGPPAPNIGNANTNSTSVTGLADNQNYYFVWTVSNGGVCPAKKDTVLLVTNFTNGLCTPAANFSYIGNTNSGIPGDVCVNSSIQFTDLSVSANTWAWDFQYNGVTFNQISTTQNPIYTYTSTGTYTVRLKIHSNATGLDYTNDQVITVIGPPAIPSGISGITSGICAGDPSQFNYSVNAVANATSYNWTYPTGCSLSTNAPDYSQISVTYSTNATDGNLIVTASNGCGTSGTRSTLIQINELPDPAGQIVETMGNSTFCQGQQSVTFVVPSINFATSYVWTLPTGITGTSTTNTITVNFGNNAVAGDISVYGHNTCGDGAINILSIHINPLPDPAGAISGLSNFNICPVPTAVTYSVSPINNSTIYSWNISNGGVIVSGDSTNSIVVNFSNAMTAGTISVSGKNACGNGTASGAVNVSFNPVTTTNMCIVSVDSASSYNEIYWTKPLTSNIDSFKVYRRQSALVNVLVGTTGYNDLSYLLDSASGASPNSHFEEYTVTCIDSCGNESDSSMFHRTMFLTPPVLGSGSVTLNWNLYVGQTVNYYRILRDTTGTGLNWEVVDPIVNPNVTMWVDNNLPATANSNLLYRVDVDWLTSCDPSRSIINTSRSNIKQQMVNTALGINSISEKDFTVMPNPANDFVIVQLRSAMKNVVVEIFDVTGRVVTSSSNIPPDSYRDQHSINLNIADLSNGIYTVRIISDNGKAMKKLVIEK